MKHEQVIEAINTHKILVFTYHDKLRVVEPHAFGVNGLLRAYQLHPVEEWRLFKIDEMQPPRFEGPRPKYNPEDAVVGREGFHARLQAA